MPESIPVGFIGLGNIGKPIARHLLGDPFQLHVYDVMPEPLAEMAELGARVADSPAQLASHCEYIGVCVRDDADVEALFYGEAGLLAHCQPGSHVAIHSTVTQANLLKWAQEAADKGFTLIDAPITGGAHRAEEGTLCYMVGGDEAALAACSDKFETSADKIVHAGDLGTGIALKLCNNYIQYTEFVAMAEAAKLAEASGLSVDVLREVGLSNGVVNEQMYMFVSGRNSLARSCSEADMDQFFGAMGRLGRKDLECALSTASDKGVELPTAEFIRDRIEKVFLAQDESRPVDALEAG